MERRSTHDSILYSRVLDGELLMDSCRRAISVAGVCGLSMGFALPAFGQEVQERTIRFGHLKFVASYEPAVAKLYADELARIHKG
jgi:hypothetical protein